MCKELLITHTLHLWVLGAPHSQPHLVPPLPLSHSLQNALPGVTAVWTAPNTFKQEMGGEVKLLGPTPLLAAPRSHLHLSNCGGGAEAQVSTGPGTLGVGGNLAWRIEDSEQSIMSPLLR